MTSPTNPERHPVFTRTTARFGVLLTAAVFALAGCSTTTTPAPEATSVAADSVTIVDPWVKAAESGMSAAFGELENSGTADVNVVSIESAASPMMELHETVDDGTGNMKMQQKEGGFVIPAGGSFLLEPGGNHFMLMGLAAPLVAGEEVTFTMTFSDGSTYEFTAPVKDYSGANEQYVGDGGMDMGGDTSGSSDDHSDHNH